MTTTDVSPGAGPGRAPPAVFLPVPTPESFDVDAFLAGLPPWREFQEPRARDTDRYARGSAGQRLRASLAAKVSDEMLREIARDTLGAVRCSQKYLDALRIVLGNQAHAEEFGYLLEMNTRTDFATEKVMRTILGQMEQAGITFKKLVVLGHGRSQAIHCFRRCAARRDPEDVLNALLRRTEGECSVDDSPTTIQAEDVPY